jgi:WD40 repeat protein
MRHPFLLLLLAAASLAHGADRTLSADARIRTIAFSPDSRTVVASYGDQHVRTWDLSTGKVIHDQAANGGLLNSNVLSERSADGKSTHIWDLSANRKMFTVTKRVAEAVLSANGKQLAVSSESDRTLLLLDPATGSTRKVLADGIGGAASIAFSPDGATVVGANYDNDIRVWQTQSGELIRKMEDFSGAMFAAAFTPDGRQLVMGGLDETVYIFDAKTFSLQRKLTGHGETIQSLAVSPDGRTLVTGGFDVFTVQNPVKLVFWDLASGEIKKTVHAPHAVVTLEFSPDGAWLGMAVAGGKDIELFHLGASTP